MLASLEVSLAMDTRFMLFYMATFSSQLMNSSLIRPTMCCVPAR